MIYAFLYWFIALTLYERYQDRKTHIDPDFVVRRITNNS